MKFWLVFLQERHPWKSIEMIQKKAGVILSWCKRTSSDVDPPHGNTNAPFRKEMLSAWLTWSLLWLQTLVVIILSSRILRWPFLLLTTTTLARVPGHPANARTYGGCMSSLCNIIFGKRNAIPCYVGLQHPGQMTATTPREKSM